MQGAVGPFGPGSAVAGALLSLLTAVACLAALVVGILPASAASGSGSPGPASAAVGPEGPEGPGFITRYVSTPEAVEQPGGITTGPGGDLWFTDGYNAMGHIASTDPGTGTISIDSNLLGSAPSPPVDIAAGPDNAVWFTVWSTKYVGRLAADGEVTQYTGSGINGPVGITLGSDGAIWFTNPVSNSIGRITTAGVVTDFTGTGIDDPQYITTVPTGPCGSPISPTTRSGGSPPRAS